jgi:prepilin-type N-terminal cleavage/methylation domain-containing protein
MRETMRKRRQKRTGGQAGMSLIELMIALAILLVVSVGILSMAMISITTTENQGHLAARTAEYAQDKMEQLLGLAFIDCKAGSPPAQCTDTTAIDTTTNSYTLGTGGTGLAAGGSVTAATSGYVDYLDANGNPLGGGATAPANWAYQRKWLVTDVSSTLKQITVMVRSRTSVGGPSVAPNSTVTSLKSSPF